MSESRKKEQKEAEKVARARTEAFVSNTQQGNNVVPAAVPVDDTEDEEEEN